MKKRLMGLFLGLSVMAMATPQGSDDTDLQPKVNLQVNATVIDVLKIKQVASMEFGELIAGAKNAKSTVSGNVEVTGEDGHSITITVPETATITRQSGTETMTVAMKEPGDHVMTLTSKKADKDLSGEIATVNTVIGNYTGTVTITARYN